MGKNRHKLKEHLIPASTFLLLFISLFHSQLIYLSCSSSITGSMRIQLVQNCSSMLLLLLQTFSCCNVSPSQVLQDKVALEWAFHQTQFLLYQPASTGPPLLWCLHTLFPFFPDLGVSSALTLHFRSALWCFGHFLTVLSLDEPLAWLWGSALCLCLA